MYDKRLTFIKYKYQTEPVLSHRVEKNMSRIENLIGSLNIIGKGQSGQTLFITLQV